MKKIILLIVILLFISNSISLAEKKDDLDSLSIAIRDKRNVSHLLGADGKDTLMDMSRSLLDVARYIVLSGAIIRLFFLYMEYANVDENPQVIASIKTKSLWYILGILFVLNFWSIIEFASDTLSKIELL